MTSNYGLLFNVCRKIVRMVYPTFHYERQEKNPEKPVVYVSHHQNLFGPFITLLWFPRVVRIWILEVFLDREACYKQYVDYTFTKRFGWNKYLAKSIAYPISFFIPKLLHSGKGIPVHRGSRKILKTLKMSVDALINGDNIAIFPDIDYHDSSSEVKDMYEGFLYLEKYYYEITGEHICFVPLYVSKKQRKIITGKNIYFRDDIKFAEERKIVLQKIQDNLNQLARSCDEI